jgi:hypothetical protein
MVLYSDFAVMARDMNKFKVNWIRTITIVHYHIENILLQFNSFLKCNNACPFDAFLKIYAQNT